MELTFDVESRGDTIVVAISGEIDLQTAPALREQVDTLLARGSRALELDMRGVTFLDSSGLGALLGIRRQVDEEGGALTLSALHPSVSKILAITRMESAFTIRPAADGGASD